MKKKNYEKPSMKVFKLQKRQHLLVGSNPTPGDPWQWD